MYSKKIRKFKLYKHNQFLLSSLITLGIICPSNLVSQPLTKGKFYEQSNGSNRSKSYVLV